MVHGHCTPTPQHKLTLFDNNSSTHQRATWIKFSNLSEYVVLIIHRFHTHREEREGRANGACTLPVYHSTQIYIALEKRPRPSTGHIDFV